MKVSLIKKDDNGNNIVKSILEVEKLNVKSNSNNKIKYNRNIILSAQIIPGKKVKSNKWLRKCKNLIFKLDNLEIQNNELEKFEIKKKLLISDLNYAYVMYKKTYKKKKDEPYNINNNNSILSIKTYRNRKE